MDKQHVGIPCDKLDRVILAVLLAQGISGIKATEKEVLLNLSRYDIELTEEVVIAITKAIPHLNFDSKTP